MLKKHEWSYKFYKCRILHLLTPVGSTILRLPDFDSFPQESINSLKLGQDLTMSEVFKQKLIWFTTSTAQNA